MLKVTLRLCSAQVIQNICVLRWWGVLLKMLHWRKTRILRPRQTFFCDFYLYIPFPQGCPKVGFWICCWPMDEDVPASQQHGHVAGHNLPSMDWGPRLHLVDLLWSTWEQNLPFREQKLDPDQVRRPHMPVFSGYQTIALIQCYCFGSKIRLCAVKVFVIELHVEANSWVWLRLRKFLLALQSRCGSYRDMRSCQTVTVLSAEWGSSLTSSLYLWMELFTFEMNANTGDDVILGHTVSFVCVGLRERERVREGKRERERKRERVKIAWKGKWVKEWEVRCRSGLV